MDLKTLIEIVLVPVGIALLALLWPMGQSRLRRYRFERLVYEELLEATPRGIDGQWYAHLDKEFVHARLIQNASDASEFILSLPARSTYELNQLWASYMAASKESADPDAVAEYGARWCWYLNAIANRLVPARPPRSWWNRRRRIELNRLCRQWVDLYRELHGKQGQDLRELARCLYEEGHRLGALRVGELAIGNLIDAYQPYGQQDWHGMFDSPLVAIARRGS